MKQENPSRLCYGAQDEHGNPDCEGSDVHRYSVRTDEGRTFETSYCGDCAAEAPHHALTLTRLDA